MFSFGSIKYNTAFYGAVTIIREKAPYNNKDELLVDQMKEIQSHYSQLCLQDYVSKIKKTYFLGLSLTNKALVWSFKTYFERFRREDIEEFTVKRMRGFPPGENFLERFRVRPNAALIRNIALRTKNYTNEMH